MTDGEVPRPAPANETALAARVRNAAPSADLPEGRVQRQLGVLVVAELLGRVRNENGQQLFLVKGGSSIELRLGVASSRTTKDLDAVFRGDFSDRGWPTSPPCPEPTLVSGLLPVVDDVLAGEQRGIQGGHALVPQT